MNAGKAIYNLLSNAAPVTAICSTRIYPVIIAQEATFPAVRYSVISVTPNDTKSGVSTNDRFRIQIDCYAFGYEECEQLDEAIRAALDDVRGTFNGVNVDAIRFQTTSDGFEDDVKLYSRRTDYSMRVRR